LVHEITLQETTKMSEEARSTMQRQAGHCNGIKSPEKPAEDVLAMSGGSAVVAWQTVRCQWSDASQYLQFAGPCGNNFLILAFWMVFANLKCTPGFAISGELL